MKNGTLLKKTQYFYSCLDDNGDLFLYNFAIGLPSFSRIPRSDIPDFHKLIDQVGLRYNSGDTRIVELVRGGYLIPEGFDELQNIFSLYYETAMDSRARIIILPTEECNFRCRYCYESYQKGKMSEEDQISLSEFIQKQMNSTNRLQISWFGGEPLEAFDVVCHIMDVVNRMAEKKCVRLVSDMSTNAYNLDAQTFDTLYNYNVRSFQITLDGMEEQHNRQRVLKDGSGTFSRVFENHCIRFCRLRLCCRSA